MTPIFDLRQLGARSPGTCQVHRRLTAGPSRSTQTVTRRGCNRMRRGPAGAHCIAEQGATPAPLRRTADRQHPFGESAASSRVRDDALRRGRILSVPGARTKPSRIFPRACRPARSPLEDRRNRGDKRFGGPLVHPGRCPLYVRAQPEAAGLGWTQRDINGPKAAAREVSKTPGHGPFPQVVAGVGFEPT